MTETTGYTLENFISDVSTMFDGFMDMAGSAMDFITSNPLALAFAIVPVIGLGVGLVKRFLY